MYACLSVVCLPEGVIAVMAVMMVHVCFVCGVFPNGLISVMAVIMACVLSEGVGCCHGCPRREAGF